MDEDKMKEINLHDFSSENLFESEEDESKKIRNFESEIDRNPAKEYEDRKYENRSFNRDEYIKNFYKENPIEKQLEDFPRPKRRSSPENIESNKNLYIPKKYKLKTERIAIVFIILTLAVSAFMIFQVISANDNLVAANQELENALSNVEYLMQMIENLEANNYYLQNQITSNQEIEENDYNDYGIYYNQENTIEEDNVELNYSIDDANDIEYDYSLILLPNTFINSDGNLVYIVQEGDSLWNIAANILGNGALYSNIVTANSLSSIDAIQPGDELIIPN